MRDWRLGLELGGGSRPESEEPIPLLLLASFISFFQETYVVSPCLSSTFSNFRSPAVNSFGEEGFDDSPGVEASSVVVVGFGSSIGEFGSGWRRGSESEEKSLRKGD